MFIIRRLGISALVLLLASVLVYFLTTISGDPLAGMREFANDPKIAAQMQARTVALDLDTPWFIRYLKWLGGAAGCVVGACNLGTDVNGSAVIDSLGSAASSTLRLVLLSVILACIVGILVGVVTAIRQYSDFDYVVTFVAFVLFSLPVFWVAVLLKEYAAIRYNNWIANPSFTPVQIALTALILGVILQLAVGGRLKRRIFTFVVTAAVVGVAMPYFTWLRFWQYPQMGPAVIAIVMLAVGAFAVQTTTGFRERRVWLPALICAALVMVVYYATWNLLSEPNWWILIIGLLLAIAVPWALAASMSGRFRPQAVAASLAVTLVGAFLTVVDHLFVIWPSFMQLKPRPISTIGSGTPNFTGNFWQTFLDTGTQLILPTIVLAVVSIASYSRYSRAAMIDVQGQDYIRTAKSKGLPERTVILRHAFRNALIPIVTIVAMDFAGVIGGAVITERVFGWKGMGEMFATGLQNVDPAPVMAFVVVTGGVAVLFNLLSDVVYALIDPRIRV